MAQSMVLDAAIVQASWPQRHLHLHLSGLTLDLIFFANEDEEWAAAGSRLQLVSTLNG